MPSLTSLSLSGKKITNAVLTHMAKQPAAKKLLRLSLDASGSVFTHLPHNSAASLSLSISNRPHRPSRRRRPRRRPHRACCRSRRHHQPPLHPRRRHQRRRRPRRRPPPACHRSRPRRRPRRRRHRRRSRRHLRHRRPHPRLRRACRRSRPHRQQRRRRPRRRDRPACTPCLFLIVRATVQRPRSHAHARPLACPTLVQVHAADALKLLEAAPNLTSLSLSSHLASDTSLMQLAAAVRLCVCRDSAARVPNFGRRRPARPPALPRGGSVPDARPTLSLHLCTRPRRRVAAALLSSPSFASLGPLAGPAPGAASPGSAVR